MSPEYETKPKETESKETESKKTEKQTDVVAVKGGQDNHSGGVHTGDSARIPLAAGMAVFSGLAVVATGLRRKKEDEE